MGLELCTPFKRMTEIDRLIDSGGVENDVTMVLRRVGPYKEGVTNDQKLNHIFPTLPHRSSIVISFSVVYVYDILQAGRFNA